MLRIANQNVNENPDGESFKAKYRKSGASVSDYADPMEALSES